MSSRNIVVVGASAGGFEALKTLVRGLPADLPASIFIVWHTSPKTPCVLAEILDRLGTIPSGPARDRELIESRRIYVAPPDHHLLVEKPRMYVTRGPKENRFRPAVDPLFRSAAYYYGPEVIGIILSGALDDGTSGLWTVKHYGGTAIVQDPNDAEVPSMPENAIREVSVDHTVPVARMPELLTALINDKQDPPRTPLVDADDVHTRQLRTEIGIAAEKTRLDNGIGRLTPYTCPDCHGTLSALRDGDIARFRCHGGHAFTANSLLGTVTESIESSLRTAVRGVDESIMLLNHMGDHFAEINQPRLAALYFRKAKEVRERNESVRRAVLSHEQLGVDSVPERSDRDDEVAAAVQQEMPARAED